MRKLMLASVSTLAMSLAGLGLAYAQAPSDSAAPTTSTTPAPPSSMPATPGTQTPSTQSNQATPSDQGAQGAMNAPGQGTDQNSQGAMNTPGMQANPNMSAEATPSRTQLRQAQQQLRADGLYKGRIDGRMGPRTRRAVLAFQQQHNLNATGTLDQQTIDAMQNGQGGMNGQTGQNNRG
jgi:hypothetical protein